MLCSMTCARARPLIHVWKSCQFLRGYYSAFAKDGLVRLDDYIAKKCPLHPVYTDLLEASPQSNIQFLTSFNSVFPLSEFVVQMPSW